MDCFASLAMTARNFALDYVVATCVGVASAGRLASSACNVLVVE
jgi:hypothetical protein